MLLTGCGFGQDVFRAAASNGDAESSSRRSIVCAIVGVGAKVVNIVGDELVVGM